MSSQSLKLTILVCVAAVAVQIAAILVPVAVLPMFNMAVRPLVFAVLAAVVFALMGRDARPIPNAYSFTLMAVVTVVLFGITLLVTTFLLGYAINPMAHSFTSVRNNLWNFGVVVILGEFMRYKLIKGANRQTRTGVVIALTLALAITHMVAGRAFFVGVTEVSVESVFVTFIAPLFISVAASYFAVKGSFLSVIMVGFVYTMARHMLPFLPDVSPLVFSLIISGCLFVSLIICHFVTNNKSRTTRIREKRLARYAPKPVFGYAVTGAMIVVIVAFFVGTFPIYPIVVLTGSMEPVLMRGSLAFVERVQTEDVFDMVGEGYVIHFEDPFGTVFIHRVVGHWYNHHGDRYYITQGDAGEAQDPFPISQGNVRGIARASLPFFGYPYIFFQNIQNIFN